MNINSKIKSIEKITTFLYRRLENCDICPRNCKINRLKGERGYCGQGKEVTVYTAFSHHGEEPAITGENGSGTIFFSGCNLKCIYCQNYKFSHLGQGKIINETDLAKIYLNLQEKGTHNINMVTPTHFLPQILNSLLIAFNKGLKLPLVYNTSGYEKKEIIEHLGEIVDIYLTDMKYITPSLAERYSNAYDYPYFNQDSIKKMYSQKNNLWEGDLMKEGMIIRHLVLPNNIRETIEILNWIKENTPSVMLSIMFQYQPYFKANLYSEINRTVNYDEYKKIKEFIEELGLEGWMQDLNTKEELAGVHFNPSF